MSAFLLLRNIGAFSVDELRGQRDRLKDFIRACAALEMRDGADLLCESSEAKERLVAIERRLEFLVSALQLPVERPRLCLVQGHPNCDAQQLDGPRSAS